MRGLIRTLLLPMLLTSPGAAFVQAQSQPPVREDSQLTQGRALLSRGDAAGALALARSLLGADPASVEALALAIDAELAASGPSAALASYEKWAHANQREAPAALHQIVRAMLRGTLSTTTAGPQRLVILKALAADGDTEAADALALAPAKSDVLDNDRAITNLIAQLENPAPMVRMRAILALGESHSPRALNPLVGMLQDSDVNVRAAAATALGRFGSKAAIGPLKLVLDDQFPVHFQAAAALFALGDASALPWLRSLESSEHDGIRLAVAQATRSQPDGSWLVLVRTLMRSDDPNVRRQAAELLAPHDPAAARDVLAPMLADQNVALRDLATATYLEQAETDLGVLRSFLSKSGTDVRIKAAMRILELTR